MSKLESQLTIQDFPVPRFFYGTAWKEEDTASLTYNALKSGFRAVDTANQRKHYFEEGAGLGISKFLNENDVSREDLFLQTKFTYLKGQDHRLPYGESDSFSKQVMDSFENSLQHLNTHYVDSYVLHGPYGERIGKEDIETWTAMEQLFDDGKAMLLGVSNIDPVQLNELCDNVNVLPHFVQNRCYAKLGWDRPVRDVCKERGIAYQGFSLLTANSEELASPFVAELSLKHKKTIPQIVFRFCQQIGILTLTGTSKPHHMSEDLNIYDFELSADEINGLERIGI